MRADKFTVKTREALVEAQQLASRKGTGRASAGTPAALAALARRGVVSAIPTKLGAKGVSSRTWPPDRLREQLDRHIDQQPRASGELDVGLSRKARDLIETAEKEAEKLKDEYTSTEHFLLALCAKDFGYASKLLREGGVTSDKVLQALSEVRGSQRVVDQDPEGKYQALERYTRDITELARKGQARPVIGRDEEIRRSIQKCCHDAPRTTPVLIGEPGVGKTAVVEGIAQRIVAGDVPELEEQAHHGARSGQHGRGQQVSWRGPKRSPQRRCSKIVAANGQIILFIDELHTLVGAGASGGAQDAANMLKPALARGELRYMGATTLDEYRKHIEKDKALERRFQPVFIGEPSVARHAVDPARHQRKVRSAPRHSHPRQRALVAALDCRIATSPDRFLPDKAIDLIDEAAARLKMEIDSMPAPIDKRAPHHQSADRAAGDVERTRRSQQAAAQRSRARIAELREEISEMKARWQSERDVITGLRDLAAEIDKTKTESELAQRRGDLNRAAELRYGKLPELEEEARRAEQEAWRPTARRSYLREEVTEEDIATIVSRNGPASRSTRCWKARSSA